MRATMPGMSDSPRGWTSPAGGATPQGPTPPAPAGPPPGWEPPPGWGGPQGPAYGGWGAPRPPEPQPGVIPLRPLGLGELLDGAVGVVRRYPRPALGMSAALAVVTTLLNLVLAATLFRSLLSLDTQSLTSGSTSAAQLQDALGGAGLGAVASSVVGALATLILTGIVTAIAGRAVLGKPMTLGEAWVEVRPALPRLLGVAVLTGLAVYGTVAVGLALAGLLVATAGTVGIVLAVPLVLASLAGAVYLYCRFALAPSVAVLEKAGVVTALRRSGVLVRRSWWRVLGILLLTFVIASFVTQVLQVPFLLFGVAPIGLPGDSGSGLGGQTTRLMILSYIGAGIAQTVVAPFIAAVRALLYVDRRMRAEGLDLALSAAAAQPSP
jgi:hypothetical protein